MKISQAVWLVIILTSSIVAAEEEEVFELVLPKGQKDFSILKRGDLKIWSELSGNRFLVSKVHDRGRELILAKKTEKHFVPTHFHHRPFSKFIIQYVKLEPIKDGLSKKLPRGVKITWHVIPNSQVILRIDSIYSNVTSYYLSTSPSVVHFDFVRPVTHHTYFGEQVISPHVLPRYSGGGATMAIMDTGLDYTHCYFSSTPKNWLVYNGANGQQLTKLIEKDNSRFIAYIKMDLFDGVEHDESDFDALPDDHGTHTSGTAVGDDSQCKLKQGLYSKARFIFLDASAGNNEKLIIPESLTDMLEMLYAMGVRVFSNSWGSESSDYSYQAMEIDDFLYKHKDFIVVQSAGNSGPRLKTIGSPAVFKNGIAIGASQNSEKSFDFDQQSCWEGNNTFSFFKHHTGRAANLADFSSRGPTPEGRTKPDFVTPGEYILSARAKKGTRNELLYMRGSSMSAPLAARIVDHLIKWLNNRWHHAPTNYLIKSILATTAIPLDGLSVRLIKNQTTIMGISHEKIPKEGVGWGLLSLESIDKLNFIDEQPIDTFTQYNLCLKSEKTQTVKVSISWNDPAGRVGKGDLIYDLNLQAEINGKVWTLLDTKNNIERIEFTAYKGEDVRITVSAYDTARTEFALSYIGEFTEKPCPSSCTSLSPPLQCATGGEIGAKECINGQWSERCSLWCHQKWYYFKNERCQCIHSIPSNSINHIDKSNILSICNNGTLLQPKEFVFTAPKRTVELNRAPPIRRLMANSPGLNWQAIVAICVSVGGAIGFVYFKIISKRKFK